MRCRCDANAEVYFNGVINRIIVAIVFMLMSLTVGNIEDVEYCVVCCML